MEIGVGVIEILGDRQIGAGLGFASKGVEVLARGARLRVPFRVGGDGEAEGVAGFGADEFDEFAGVAEFAGFGHAGGQVAAQCDKAADAARLVIGEDFADVFARRADAGKMRGNGLAGFGNVPADGEGTFARRAAGTEGDGEEIGLERRQLAPHDAQFFKSLAGLRREKFDGKLHGRDVDRESQRSQEKDQRLPSRAPVSTQETTL